MLNEVYISCCIDGPLLTPYWAIVWTPSNLATLGTGMIREVASIQRVKEISKWSQERGILISGVLKFEELHRTALAL